MIMRKEIIISATTWSVKKPYLRLLRWKPRSSVYAVAQRNCYFAGLDWGIGNRERARVLARQWLFDSTGVLLNLGLNRIVRSAEAFLMLS